MSQDDRKILAERIPYLDENISQKLKIIKLKKNQIDNLKFKKIVNKLDFKNIFYPTDTSRLLINASDKYLKPKQKILDLGCGGGIISFCL